MGEADGMELIYSLIGYPDETEWLEFKEGNSDPLERGVTSRRCQRCRLLRPCICL